MHYLHIFIFSVFSCGPHGRQAAAAARHHGSQQNYMAVIGPKSRTVRSGLFGFDDVIAPLIPDQTAANTTSDIKHRVLTAALMELGFEL